LKGRFHEAVQDTTEALRIQPDFTDALKCQQQSIIDGKLG